MKRSESSLLILVAVVVVSCAKPSLSDLSDPEAIYKEGNSLYEDGFYEESRAFFNKVKSQYPESPRLYDSELRIADSYLEEDKYVLAAETYNEFVKIHPSHERVPYALYQMGRAYDEELPSTIDRDQTSAHKAMSAYRRVILDHPQYEGVGEAKKRLDRLRNRLAGRVLYIADFYYRKEHWNAAVGRYRQLLALYPDEAGLIEQAYLKLIRALLKQKKVQEAKREFESFQKALPESSKLRVFSDSTFAPTASQ